MIKKTILHPLHAQSGALLVDFAGWEMPIHYGSQLTEHHIVRQDAGCFDVSHMTGVDIQGRQATAFLQTVLANDVAKCKTIGKALYSCMLNATGGVIDDLIVYKCADDAYRLVINAGTTDKDLAWLAEQAKAFDVTVTPLKDYAIIAIQGPNAIQKMQTVFNATQQAAAESLSVFSAVQVAEWMIAKTGYTGEAGYEILLPNQDAPSLWQALIDADIKPCGLGARDTLRLESGYNLYGQDMDETVTPLESNLAWTVDFNNPDRQFIGRAALEKQSVQQHLVGIVLTERGVCRHGQTVIVPNVGQGVITSGTFSPSLQVGIALARVPVGYASDCFVEIRQKRVSARIISAPFIKNGEATFSVIGETQT